MGPFGSLLDSKPANSIASAESAARVLEKFVGKGRESDKKTAADLAAIKKNLGKMSKGIETVRAAAENSGSASSKKLSEFASAINIIDSNVGEITSTILENISEGNEYSQESAELLAWMREELSSLVKEFRDFSKGVPAKKSAEKQDDLIKSIVSVKKTIDDLAKSMSSGKIDPKMVDRVAKSAAKLLEDTMVVGKGALSQRVKDAADVAQQEAERIARSGGDFTVSSLRESSDIVDAAKKKTERALEMDREFEEKERSALDSATRAAAALASASERRAPEKSGTESAKEDAYSGVSDRAAEAISDIEIVYESLKFALERAAKEGLGDAVRDSRFKAEIRRQLLGETPGGRKSRRLEETPYAYELVEEIGKMISKAKKNWSPEFTERAIKLIDAAMDRLDRVFDTETGAIAKIPGVAENAVARSLADMVRDIEDAYYSPENPGEGLRNSATNRVSPSQREAEAAAVVASGKAHEAITMAEKIAGMSDSESESMRESRSAAASVPEQFRVARAIAESLSDFWEERLSSPNAEANEESLRALSAAAEHLSEAAKRSSEVTEEERALIADKLLPIVRDIESDAARSGGKRKKSLRASKMASIFDAAEDWTGIGLFGELAKHSRKRAERLEDEIEIEKRDFEEKKKSHEKYGVGDLAADESPGGALVSAYDRAVDKIGEKFDAVYSAIFGKNDDATEAYEKELVEERQAVALEKIAENTEKSDEEHGSEDGAATVGGIAGGMASLLISGMRAVLLSPATWAALGAVVAAALLKSQKAKYDESKRELSEKSADLAKMLERAAAERPDLYREGSESLERDIDSARRDLTSGDPKKISRAHERLKRLTDSKTGGRDSELLSRINDASVRHGEKTGDFYDVYKRGPGRIVPKPNADMSGLDPVFAGSLMSAAAESGRDVHVNSAFRSSAEQSALYSAYLADPAHNPKAAPPGRSMHEKGLAADINSADANAMDSAGLLEKYGLSRPVSGEPWHLQMSEKKQPEEYSGTRDPVDYSSAPGKSESKTSRRLGEMSAVRDTPPPAQQQGQNVIVVPVQSQQGGSAPERQGQQWLGDHLLAEHFFLFALESVM